MWEGTRSFPCVHDGLGVKSSMRNRLNLIGWGLLLTAFIGMSIYLFQNPNRVGVVTNYRLATTRWWAGEPIYVGGTHGFLYFPSFILFFTPFNLMRPEIFGEIVWRVFGFGLFGWGLWRLARTLLEPGRSGTTGPSFLWMVVLAVPASLASLSNGQTNLPLSACMVFGVLALRKKHWNVAAFWLTLAMILKPIALAPWLLAWAVFPAIRRPLFLGLIALVVLGLANLDFHYALGRWGKCLEKIIISYSPENLRVSDLFGAFEKAGIRFQPLLVKALRAGACMGALFWVRHLNKTQGVSGASWALWVASALVWTLFNPRAETNSYVLISPLLAFAAVNYWREDEGSRWKGIVLAAACLGLMCDGMGLWIYKATDVWFKPLIVLLVSPLLFRVPMVWKVESGRRED